MAKDNATVVTYPDGTAFHSVFDALNRLTAVQNAAQANLVSYRYSSLSEMTQSDRKSGARSTYSFDEASRLSAIAHKASATRDGLAPVPRLYPRRRRPNHRADRRPRRDELRIRRDLPLDRRRSPRHRPLPGPGLRLRQGGQQEERRRHPAGCPSTFARTAGTQSTRPRPSGAEPRSARPPCGRRQRR